jgi:hypothetical protein
MAAHGLPWLGSDTEARGCGITGDAAVLDVGRIAVRTMIELLVRDVGGAASGDHA